MNQENILQDGVKNDKSRGRFQDTQGKRSSKESEINQESPTPTVGGDGGNLRNGAKNIRQNLNALNYKYRMGLKLLPDILDFQIKLGGPDELLKSVGVKLNEQAELKFQP